MSSIYIKWFALPLLANAFITALILILLQSYQAFMSHHLFLEVNAYLILIIFLISQNIVTLPQLYRIDKKRSKRPNQERVPEVILHIFTTFGGIFGAFYAQNRFRHKTQKTTFKISNGLGLVVFLGATYFLWQPI